MTRKNKKALFKLSPIACALALSFAFGAAPAVHAYERESSSYLPFSRAALKPNGVSNYLNK